MRILIADDHVPDDDIHDTAISVEIPRRYQDGKALVEYFTFMRELVTALRGKGYDVSICNRASKIEATLQAVQMDLCVVDLGWFADNELSYQEQKFQGWAIIDKIRKLQPKMPIILYSNRFQEQPQIADGAAERNVYPMQKDLTKSCIGVLIATIRYSTKVREKSVQERVKDIDLGSYQAISQLTKYLFVAFALLIVIGGALILGGTVKEGIVVSVVSVFAGAIQTLFWKHLKRLRKTLQA